MSNKYNDAIKEQKNEIGMSKLKILELKSARAIMDYFEKNLDALEDYCNDKLLTKEELFEILSSEKINSGYNKMNIAFFYDVESWINKREKKNIKK